MSELVRDNVSVAAAPCPECGALLCLYRPSQAQVFPCPCCRCDLRVSGGFLEECAYAWASRIHYLTEC